MTRKMLSVISLASLLAFVAPSFAADSPTFDQLDVNKDGVLSMAEAKAAPNIDFAKADTNKDGKLDRAEFKAAVG